MSSVILCRAGRQENQSFVMDACLGLLPFQRCSGDVQDVLGISALNVMKTRRLSNGPKVAIDGLVKTACWTGIILPLKRLLELTRSCLQRGLQDDEQLLNAFDRYKRDLSHDPKEEKRAVDPKVRLVMKTIHENQISNQNSFVMDAAVVQVSKPVDQRFDRKSLSSDQQHMTWHESSASFAW